MQSRYLRIALPFLAALASGLLCGGAKAGADGGRLETGSVHADCTRDDTRERFFLEINFNSATIRAAWKEENGATYLRTFAAKVTEDSITWTTGHEMKYGPRGQAYDEIDTWTLSRHSGAGLYMGDSYRMVRYQFHCQL